MAGVFGFVGRPPGITAADLGARIRGILHQSRHETIDLWTGDDACLGLVHLGIFHSVAQPVHDPITNTRLVLDGEIADPARVAADLRAEGVRLPADVSEPELLLALYHARGPDAFADVDGSWAVAIVESGGTSSPEARSPRVTLITDRNGMRPITIVKRHWGLAFFPEIKGSLALGDFEPRVDPAALVEFFLFQHALGHKTLLEGATMVPPASVLTFRDGRIEIREYWSIAAPAFYDTRTVNEHAEDVAGCLSRAVRKRIAKPPSAGSTLSGGIDTRLMLAAADPGAPPLQTFTFGEPGSRDRRFARRAARARGTIHHETGPEYERFVANADRYIWFSDSMVPAYHGTIGALFPLVRGRLEVLLDGVSGSSGFLVQFPRGRFDLLAPIREEAFVAAYARRRTLLPASIAGRILPDPLAARAAAYPTPEFAALLGSVDAPPWIRACTFSWRQHIRRFSSTGGRYMRMAFEVRQPFFDHELLDCVLALPPHVLVDPLFMSRVISRLSPSLDRVPFASHGLPGDPKLTEQFLRWRKNQIKNFVSRWTGGRIPRLDSRVTFDQAAPLRGAFGARVRAVLRDARAFDRGLLRAEGVRGILNEHFEGRANHAKLIWTLYGFEVWGRQALDGERGDLGLFE